MDIETKIQELSDRITRIEARMGLVGHPVHTAKAAIEPTPSSSSRSSFSSAKLLASVAVLCVIIGSAFIIKLAIDSGWLTPLRQVGLAATVGGVLIASGLLVKDRDPAYAAYLPAAGVITLFLSIFGAHLLYGLIQQETAVILSGAVSVLSLWLFTVFRTDIFPLCAATGSYVTPVVIGFLWKDFSSMTLYFVGWSTTYAILAIFVRSRTLSILSAYFGVGLLGYLSVDHPLPDATLSFVATIQAIQFAILLAGTVSYSIIHETPLTSNESFFLYPLLGFFYAVEYAILKDAAPTTAPYVMLVLGAAVAAAFWGTQRLVPHVGASRSLVEAYCMLTLYHALYLVILSDTQRPLILIALLAASLIPGKSSGTRSLTGTLLVFMIVFKEYGSIVLELIERGSGTQPVLWRCYGFVISLLLLLKGIRATEAATRSNAMLYLILGHSLFVATLYSLFEPMGSIPLSLAWTAYALSVLGIGFKTRNEPLAKSSLAVLFFAVGKVFTYDVANAASIVRIVCLFLTAAVLYACGWILRKIEGWK